MVPWPCTHGNHPPVAQSWTALVGSTASETAAPLDVTSAALSPLPPSSGLALAAPAFSAASCVPLESDGAFVSLTCQTVLRLLSRRTRASCRPQRRCRPFSCDAVLVPIHPMTVASGDRFLSAVDSSSTDPCTYTSRCSQLEAAPPMRFRDRLCQVPLVKNAGLDLHQAQHLCPRCRSAYCEQTSRHTVYATL
jgi:hypothetical protein